MFTGIIESIGQITQIEKGTFFVSAPFLSELKIGESVAHDGVCLTVTKIHSDSYEVDLMPETFERTHFSKKKIGDILNLERSMKANGRFDGHIVQGHCDCVGRLESITPDGNAFVLRISFPTEYAPYFVEKGSVALNGISLTVIKAEKDAFTVGIIPHTWANTNLHTLKTGDLVNIETDIVAKYLVKMSV